jgi:WD40 repeat protein
VAFGTTVRTYEEDEEPTTEDFPGVAPKATLVPGPNGSLAALTAEGAVKLFDPRDRRWLDLPPDGDAAAVAFAADGNVVAVGSRGGTIRLWDVVSRTPLTDAVNVGGPVSSAAVAMSATAYTVLARANEVVMLTCPRPFVSGPIRLPADPGEEVLGVAFSATRDAVYVTSPAGVSLWQFGPGGQFKRVVSPRDRYSGWLQSGRFAAAHLVGPVAAGRESLVVAGSGGKLFHVDPDRGVDLARTRVADGDVMTVAALPDGRVCAACRNRDRTCVVRHWAHGLADDPGAAFPVDGQVRSSALLPDGSAIVLGLENGTVRLCDPVTGREERSLAGGSPVLAVAVSDDGARILTGCADGTAHLWDRASGRELQVVRHRAAVRAVAFQGADPLTASADGTTRRWDAGTGLPIGPPLMHADAVTALAARGPLAATGGRDRVVRVWRLP